MVTLYLLLLAWLMGGSPPAQVHGADNARVIVCYYTPAGCYCVELPQDRRPRRRLLPAPPPEDRQARPHRYDQLP